MKQPQIIKYLKTIVLVFLGLVSIFLLLISFPGKIPFKAFIVTSGSMRPKIAEGSVVVVKRGNDNLKVNDVITFIRPDNFKENITHRITEIKTDPKIAYTTKGDANNVVDNWQVNKEKIWGKVMFSVPFLGHLINFSRTKVGSIIVFVIPALLIILSEIIDIYKNFKKPKITAALIILMMLSFTKSIGYTKSFYSIKSIAINNQAVTTCWQAPSGPVLTTPLTDQYLNSLSVDFSWQESVDPCHNSKTYRIALYSDQEKSNLIYRSDYDSTRTFNYTFETVGNYWWQVEVINQYGHASLSPLQKFTLDTSLPTSSLSQPDPSIQKTTQINLNYSVSDDNFDYLQLCYSYNLGSWICNSENRYDQPSNIANFVATQGDGIYQFYSLAVDQAGNSEDSTGKTSSPVSVQIDTLAPTTNISLPQDVFDGQNLLLNGDFSNGLNNWTVGRTDVGDHLITTSGLGLLGEAITPMVGGNMLQLGFQTSAPFDATDSLWSDFTLPQNQLSQLSFWYRFISNDTVDYDTFQSKIITYDLTNEYITPVVLTGGNESPGSMSYTGYDSGWKQITQDLPFVSGTAPKSVRIWFGVNDNNQSVNFNSWAFVNNIKVSTVTASTADSSAPNTDAHDTGSGIDTTTTTSPLTQPENTVSVGSTDLAGNPETNHPTTVNLVSSIVLNKINFTTPAVLDVYNNSTATVNLSSYYLQNSSGSTLPFTAVDLAANTSYSITLPSDFINYSVDTLKLFNDQGQQDQTNYQNQLANNLWYRSPNGLGSWVTSNPTPVLTASLNYKTGNQSKIIMSLNHLTSEYLPASYEIIYSSAGLEKGIAGTIEAHTVVNDKTDREFILGTCSFEGCTVDSQIGTSATLILTDTAGDTTYLNQIFNLQ
ncbi:MAG TPA: signal peptidase I [Candidatus Woesebacteria bacterium]|nr:signal peptidase I [Candidatus Woesebacteria bacterium]